MLVLNLTKSIIGIYTCLLLVIVFTLRDAELRGLLVSPQGENMDQLTLQLLSTQSQSKVYSSETMVLNLFLPRLP